METYEESVELTRTFVKTESTNPGTEEAAMRDAILAYLKDTSCEIQLDDVGNGRKNIIATLWPENIKEESIKEKYKEIYKLINEDLPTYPIYERCDLICYNTRVQNIEQSSYVKWYQQDKIVNIEVE